MLIEENDRLQSDNVQNSNVIEKFRARTDRLFQEIDNLSASDIEIIVLEEAKEILADYDVDTVAVDAVLCGSRCRGLEHEASDIDVVVEIHGENEREDSLHDLLNDERLTIGGINVDINPILPKDTGTLAEYLPRVEEYLEEKARELSEALNEKKEVDKSSLQCAKYSNFKIKELPEDKRYNLIADVKLNTGNIMSSQVIGEFKDRASIIEFCRQNNIVYDDITNYLQNTIEHKKYQANKKKESDNDKNELSINKKGKGAGLDDNN